MKNVGILIIYFLIMLSAGYFGGVVNYYLEQKENTRSKFLFKKSIFLGIGAAFMVPLFLHLISSSLIKMEQFDPKDIMIFTGFCLVASISSRKFIQTLSSKVLKQVQEAKDKADDVKQDVEKQITINARAVELVEQLVDEKITSDDMDINIDKLKEGVRTASVGTRIEIFTKVREFRRKNYKNNPELIGRVIPVFDALITSDIDEAYHRNHAQIAYIYKDMKPKPDYKKAIDELTKAITIRNKTIKDKFLIYEFNRAICKIALDPAFSNKKLSSETDRDGILADLKAASQNEYWKSTILKEEADKKTMLSNWLTLNKIDSTHLK